MWMCVISFLNGWNSVITLQCSLCKRVNEPSFQLLKLTDFHKIWYKIIILKATTMSQF
jgi:hypothetical protein